ncbi:RecQ family ATP-dependent DNA helicase [Microbacterium sp. SA39]|uniref:RecQ family ATP-dependent DNA helicase n=1 Tax=Microbacterium sp. SA39 TaxID=1263625 RepID=UPI0005FA1A58|nr:RecQ family ATP-dependent DNA helicase [Microbacterium sp. SA39]KJQ52500.1 ATP-dependent DNA helicase RecQ [Microbacterium sp. SA39]
MTTTPTLAETRRTAREAFGWDTLLPGQAEAITSVVGGRDTLVVFPTGAGKSAVYQIAGLELGGVTVVISPLLALQRDQVASIDAAPDAPAAVALNSRTSARAERAAWQAIENGQPVYAFVAPEQLARDEVLQRLLAADVRLLVVDEAHCVSAWGHDFRPDYARIGDAVAALGHPPVLALTATASSPVRSDIIERLGMRDPHLEVRGMDRPEIHLAVRRYEEDGAKRRAVLEEVAAEPGATLLYVATRRETEEYVAALEKRGRRAAAYHGAMSTKRRDAVHAAWSAGELDVVAATSAFGMGIDKPDVRLVAHADVTESLDAYAQEIGRAARDGKPARAVLHYRPEDFSLRSFFAAGHSKPAQVTAVWSALTHADGRVRAKAVAEVAGLSGRAVSRILGSLVAVGAATSTAKGFAAVAGRTRDEVVADVREEDDAQQRIRESRIAVMRGYAESVRCRRIALLDYFGVDAPDACGACDRCDAADAGAAPSIAEGRDDDDLHPDDAVRHAEWGAGTVVSIEADRMTVFFEQQGYKVVAREALDRGILDVV